MSEIIALKCGLCNVRVLSLLYLNAMKKIIFSRIHIRISCKALFFLDICFNVRKRARDDNYNPGDNHSEFYYENVNDILKRE